MKSNMSTPIVDFLEKYKNSDISRLHMPGHKGKTYGYKNIPVWLSDTFAYDITEIKGADDRYHPGGCYEHPGKNGDERRDRSKSVRQGIRAEDHGGRAACDHCL